MDSASRRDSLFREAPTGKSVCMEASTCGARACCDNRPVPPLLETPSRSTSIRCRLHRDCSRRLVRVAPKNAPEAGRKRNAPLPRQAQVLPRSSPRLRSTPCIASFFSSLVAPAMGKAFPNHATSERWVLVWIRFAHLWATPLVESTNRVPRALPLPSRNPLDNAVASRLRPRDRY